MSQASQVTQKSLQKKNKKETPISYMDQISIRLCHRGRHGQEKMKIIADKVINSDGVSKGSGGRQKSQKVI